ncbi:metallophosphoesterase [Flavobacterium rhizosphaerae]|uniref:Metallophosphoesterase n=1 Tax=Flavobacterium rhizosphaerae TaxID=3163298 RepID=A0ABW8YVE2_9FLAO
MFRYILIFFLFFGLVAEIYTYIAVRTVIKTKWIQWAYLAVSLIILAYIIYSFVTFDRSHGQTKRSLFTVALLLLTLLPKMIITIILLGEDIVRIIAGGINLITKGREGGFLPERRKFVSLTAMGLAAIPFLSLLYGIAKGKYNFKVRKKTLTFTDLPDNFDGFIITQISDVHSGSLDNAEKIEYAINLINEQNADLILFTGDIVNTYAEEMHPWIDAFNKIENAPYGKFSVLGNHDYGEYAEWPSQAAKDKNFEAIKALYGRIGFKLLLNENVKIKKKGQEIALAGVENWGLNFKKAGDLEKASEGLTPGDFKVLMSHDPSHWNSVVKNSPHNYHLTLSGHTHGMQFGIEVPPYIKWSPVQYIYKQWAGLYEHLGRYIYVNRGFGFHGYGGRTGIWPEITVITLKKG